MTFQVFVSIAGESCPTAKEKALVKAKDMINLTSWSFYDYIDGKYHYDKIVPSRIDDAIKYYDLTKKKYISLDIEPTGLDWRLSARSQARYLYQLKTAAEYVKKKAPKVLAGIYAYLPVRDAWIHTKGEESLEYKDWQMLNDLINEVAVKYCEYLTPSLYTYYEDRKLWVDSTICNLKEARRCAKGRKVYPFLWPCYHPNSGGQPRAWEFMEADFFKEQLELVRELADGVVIWLHDKGPFDPNWGWWRVTKEVFG